MRENEFEKQVREKMDHLGFDPRDTVWTAVDKEINKEKKRRIPLFWLFFLPALLMAGGAYYLIEHKGSPDAIAKNLQQPELNKNQISQPEPKSEKKDKKTEELIDKNIKPEENSTIQTSQRISQRKSSAESKKSGVANKKTRAGGSMDKEQSGESGQNSIPGKSDEIVIDNYSRKSTQSETENLNKDVLDSSTGKAIAGITANKNVKKDSVSESAAAKNKNQKTKSSTWQFGITGGAGISNINQGLFSSVKTLNITTAANAAAYPPAPANPTTYSSSEIKPGFSFETGAYVQRNLSRRISLSAGLNYHYYSAKIKTGDKGNAALYSPYNTTSFTGNTFYQNGNVQTFTEQYHLIEIPVSANLQLNKSSRVPFIWEVGLSLGYIVSSNALYYDPNANIYIANYQQPNRMQVNAATALMIGFHLHKNEMQVGPQLQYGLTGLLNTNDGNPGHLFYGGLKISYILPKK
jgi:Outer membrane protein beta-barrel domain